jgi:two-component sensor histidine kinase
MEFILSNKNRSFWIAQLIGWALLGGSNFTIQSILGFPFSLAFANSFYVFLSGFTVSTIYRFIIRKIDWTKWKIWGLLFFILISSGILAALWLWATGMLFELFEPQYRLTFREVLGNLGNGCIIFLMWNSFYFFFKFYAKFHSAEIEKWKLAAEIKEAQLGTLKAQINPHFVFNTLNNIKALILEDPNKARTTLMNFSELFRYALLNTKKELISLSEEVSIIKQYLELLAIQYEERLSYRFEIDEEILDEKIPPMMLQLLVENAIKHGIALSKNGGELIIHIYPKGKIYCVDVKNTGQINERASIESRLGTGLKNIKERLKLIYGSKASLQLFENVPYVVASLKIPYRL